MQEIVFSKNISKDQILDAKYTGAFPERSELAQEIISRKPDFWEKWALYIFVGILFLVIGATWFISNPDLVRGEALLSGDNLPKEIVPKQTGKLSALLVQNNELVKEGQILGWIESNADVNEVIQLSQMLDSSANMIGTDSFISKPAFFTRRFAHLGELQDNYQAFIVSLQLYIDYQKNGFFAKKKQQLLSDIALLQNIKQNSSRQKELIDKEGDLAKKTFEMNELLYKEKVISAEEYRQAQATLLSKQKNTPQAETEILSQQSLIFEKQKMIDQLDHDIIQQRQSFEQSVHTLKSHVDEWIRQYIIRSPSEGTVVFAQPLQKNQYVVKEKTLGVINSAGSEYYAEIRLDQGNLGKVDSGMKVQLRFEAYPYQENGIVYGTLSYISSVPVDGQFIGTIQLDKGLKTNQGKILQYKSGLKAQALIITRDMRLLERIYYSVVKSNKLNS